MCAGEGEGEAEGETARGEKRDFFAFVCGDFGLEEGGERRREGEGEGGWCSRLGVCFGVKCFVKLSHFDFGVALGDERGEEGGVERMDNRAFGAFSFSFFVSLFPLEGVSAGAISSASSPSPVTSTFFLSLFFLESEFVKMLFFPFGVWPFALMGLTFVFFLHPPAPPSLSLLSLPAVPILFLSVSPKGENSKSNGQMTSS